FEHGLKVGRYLGVRCDRSQGFAGGGQLTWDAADPDLVVEVAVPVDVVDVLDGDLGVEGGSGGVPAHRRPRPFGELVAAAQIVDGVHQVLRTAVSVLYSAVSSPTRVIATGRPGRSPVLTRYRPRPGCAVPGNHASGAAHEVTRSRSGAVSLMTRPTRS